MMGLLKWQVLPEVSLFAGANNAPAGFVLVGL